MGEEYVQLKVRPRTKNRLMSECVDAFIKDHPEFDHFHITQDFILDKVTKYYLEND